MNRDQILRDFPILSSSMRGKDFVYLDSGATSLTPEPVIEAMNRYYREYGVNIHRGVYEFSERATREYQQVRMAVKKFIGGDDSGHVLFTHGSTESSNLIAYSWGLKFLRQGDVILTTEYEHHSSLVPWHNVCERTGARLEFIPMSRETLELDLDACRTLLDRGVRLLVMSGMSNVTGYMPPVAEIIEMAHENGAIVALDGAQLVSHHGVDVAVLKPDFLYFSAHKMLGPTGLGVLWGRTELLEAMDPFMYGGDMILRVARDHSTYHPLPEKFEAGTPNIAGVLGLGAAIAYLESLGIKAVEECERDLIAYALERFEGMDGFTQFVPANPGRRGGIFSFALDGLHPHDLGAVLDAQGIAIRTGFHCAMPLMDWLGVPGTARASFYFYNIREDIDALYTGIVKARQVFGV